VTDAIFALMDLDGSGVISFDEYACCLVSYCLFTEADIFQFVFNLFDEDGGGSLDEVRLSTAATGGGWNSVAPPLAHVLQVFGASPGHARPRWSTGDARGDLTQEDGDRTRELNGVGVVCSDRKRS
jgi:Ca2+-binding EF-hand superfamily protein